MINSKLFWKLGLTIFFKIARPWHLSWNTRTHIHNPCLCNTQVRIILSNSFLSVYNFYSTFLLATQDYPTNNRNQNIRNNNCVCCFVLVAHIWRRNVDWRSLRMGFWGEYLGLRRTKFRGVEKIHSEKLIDLYSSINNIRMIISKRMRCSTMGWGEVHTRFCEQK
jgi:hypothetical protein